MRIMTHDQTGVHKCVNAVITKAYFSRCPDIEAHLF